MMGIDVAGIERMREFLSDHPNAEERFFTEAERRHCRAHEDPARHFAGTFAAKEAVVKALRLGPAVAWASRIEIVRAPGGEPSARCPGVDGAIPISISHDAGVAVAVALDHRALVARATG